MLNCLDELQVTPWQSLYPNTVRVTVGMATCGRAAGALEVFNTLRNLVEGSDFEIELVEVGCAGLCWAEPLVEIQLPGQGRAIYSNVESSFANTLFSGIASGNLPEEKLLGVIYSDYFPVLDTEVQLSGGKTWDKSGLPYLADQTRLVMSNCGHIQPWSIHEYQATGGYLALNHVLKEITPEEVINCIEASGLRGRGGAGFPTGLKWRLTRNNSSGLSYIIANADEGDPGAYMDRALLESDPHRVLEGIMIASYAVGASRAYIFTRSEYPLAIATLQRAIKAAESQGILGDHALGSDFSLTIKIIRSAGAFVCGEETAMIHAMENYRGDPIPRPPYPSEHGLWNAPTCVNNVETLATIPLIVARGPDWFRQFGTEKSPGTKIFSLVGAIERPGLIEVPLGISLKTIVEGIGGLTDDPPKAVQIGGPSGGILPISLAEVPVDYESMTALGAIMGSGGLVVLGQKQCVVDTVRYLVSFSSRESCGKCTPCRDGLIYCKNLLDRITNGNADPSVLDELEEVGIYISRNSLCGLGRTASSPILTSLRYFKSEFEQHLEGHCLALVCKPLVQFNVNAEKCQGCRCCTLKCPGSAIKGRFGKPSQIVGRLCTKCWMCTVTCPYGAINVSS